MLDCVEAIENDYRVINCPGYPTIDCPCEIETCAEAWSCYDLFNAVENYFFGMNNAFTVSEIDPKA